MPPGRKILQKKSDSGTIRAKSGIDIGAQKVKDSLQPTARAQNSGLNAFYPIT